MELPISPEGYGELTARERVESVTRKISSLLTETRRIELSDEILDRAASLIESIARSDEEKISQAEETEQILLTLAFARRTHKHNSESSEAMNLIFGNESSSLIHSGVVGLYLAKSYPEVWEEIGMRSKNPEKDYASMSSSQREELESRIFRWAKDNIAKGDQVVRIGHGFSQSKKIQEDIFKLLHIPKSEQTLFGAIAIKEDDLVVLAYDDPTGHDELHERNHLSPGLMAGSLGYALDEGMTEHFAIIESARKNEGTTWHTIWTDRQKDPFDVAGKFKAYLDERRLIAKITDNGRNEIYNLLVKRYKNGDETSALELASKLINKYGFEEYLHIYLASPDIPLNHKGVLQSPTKITSSLR